MSTLLIKQGTLINRGQRSVKDIFIKDGLIEEISSSINRRADQEIKAEGKIIMPGIIDDQVHFRDPGLTYKADIYTEARAAVAGGTTSFMEMPNTKPPALTQELLQQKYDRAAQVSLANFSFFMGASNDNLEQVLRTDPKTVCGVKIFMGSSTGNMLVDDESTLEDMFSKVPMLIATHCEDEATIRNNAADFRKQYGEKVPMEMHPIIRSIEGCYKSSSFAVELAKQHNTRLHILHISTAEELELFRNDIPLAEKRITAEVCVHHLYFDAGQYKQLGAQIKCNPAIKEPRHKEALLQGLLADKLDIIATDHAPHTWEEKQGTYFSAPSGVPLVQHSLNIMLQFVQEGKIGLERVVEKMCHAPAECFQLHKRGYLDEGYWADIVILDPEKTWSVTKENLHYKCNWSPLEGQDLKGKVQTTVVNGNIVYDQGKFYEDNKGQRLFFNR